MSEIPWSKITFFSTIILGVLRDIFTNDSTLELYMGVFIGVFVALAIHVLFERNQLAILEQTQVEEKTSESPME